VPGFNQSLKTAATSSFLRARVVSPSTAVPPRLTSSESPLKTSAASHSIDSSIPTMWTSRSTHWRRCSSPGLFLPLMSAFATLTEVGERSR